MTSRSSSSPSTKRKRSSSNLPAASASRLSTNEQLQPSSRDASGEEGDDSATPANRSVKSKKSTASTVTPDKEALPPPKRPRTRTVSNSENPLDDKNGTPATGAAASSASMSKVDPGEPSETTDASADIENRSSKRRHVDSDPMDAEYPDNEPIEPPAKAGLQDPVGYHTNPPPTGRPVRVYADGVFDLFHLGHMRQLEQAKHAFPDTYLIVGVAGDGETHKRKGLTVLNDAERAETLRHCKWVDEVIPQCPWIVTTEFLEEHQIDYVAHDDLPYGAAEGDDIYSPIKARGQFLVTQRTEGVSTTGIITKIVRDYEKYISRQLKRGTSRQELNVSWLKKNELELKRHVIELRDTIRNNWSTTGQEIGKDIKQLWQNSRPSSPARASMDGSGGLRSGLSSPSLGRGEGNSNFFGIGRNTPRLDVPGRPDSPTVGRSEDFATGYSLGLIGGVRSWMMRSRTSLRDPISQPDSSSGSEDERGRNGIHDQEADKATT